MSDKRHDLAVYLYVEFINNVSPEIAKQLKPVGSKPMKKGETNIMKTRVLPKRGRGFWNSAWCFYEIGVAQYKRDPGDGLIHGGVGFCCFPANKQTGGGIYYRETDSICSGYLSGKQGWAYTSRPDFVMLLRKFMLPEFGEFPNGGRSSSARRSC